MIWLALMPFGLWSGCRWLMVPVAGTIAFLLLGIDEIGVQLEEPFGILPLGGCPVRLKLSSLPACLGHSPVLTGQAWHSLIKAILQSQLRGFACCCCISLSAMLLCSIVGPCLSSACLSIVLAGCRGHLQHHPCKHR